jgi:hypothetical protein
MIEASPVYLLASAAWTWRLGSGAVFLSRLLLILPLDTLKKVREIEAYQKVRRVQVAV